MKLRNNNFEISLVVFMSNITTNHAITYTNFRENNAEEALIISKRLKCPWITEQIQILKRHLECNS